MKPWIVRIGDRKYRIEPAGQITVILVGILILALLASLLFAGKGKKKEENPDKSPEPSAQADATPEATLDPKKYEGTILAETADAGISYIENTLFLGDSNTARFLKVINPETKKTYSFRENTIGVVGMGIDGISTLPCMDFSTGRYTMPKSVSILQPERVIITMGTNNLSGENTDYTGFIERYTAQIKAIQSAYPSVDIIVNSIPPIARNTSYYNVKMKQIDAYNKGIAEMCEKNGWKYLNSSEALIDSSTGYAKSGYMVSDGLHLAQQGLTALFDYIRTHAWITDDDRPKPLAAIPNIIGVPDGLIRTDPLTSEEYKEDPSTAETEATAIPEITPTPTPSASPLATASTVPEQPSNYKTAEACRLAGYVWSDLSGRCFLNEEEMKKTESQLRQRACLAKADQGYVWDEETQSCIQNEMPQPTEETQPTPETPEEPSETTVPESEEEPDQPQEPSDGGETPQEDASSVTETSE